MSRKLLFLFQIVFVIALMSVLAACGGQAAPTQAPAAEAPAVEAPAAAPAAAGAEVKGKFVWVQSSAWHPVHQYTQQGFLAGCEAQGLDCELATTDENTLDALVALADQTVSRPDVKGVAMWFGGLPIAKPIIEKAKANGIAVVLPHFPVEEGFFADNAVQIAADTTKYPDPVAKAMCDELKSQGITTGSVAITENNHNATEDMVAQVFSDGMKKYCPDLTILPVELEGPEPTQAIAVATSIMQANPDLVAALSTTGGGPTTWAGAQSETGKKIIAVGMDTTRVNLDLVTNGEVWGLVAQPLFDETFGSAELLYKMANGQDVPYWTVLDAPLVTQDNTQYFYDLLAQVEPKFRQDAVNPDEVAPAAAGAEVKGKFVWVQSSAWHPVHQYTQQGFLAGCEAQGLDCELATTDENTLDALVALADQTVSRPDVKGVAMWFGGLPIAKPIIEKAKANGIAVVLPHFPVEEGFFADNAVQIAADTTKYPDPVAKAMCDELKSQGITTGSVAITENNHNATEDMVAQVFSDGMKKYCPDLTILPVELEGPEPTQAIAVATSIMQANPDLVAALSTTGGGPTTWAGAQSETGKKIIAVGMDTTRVNLDLVTNGEVWGLVAQPLFDETFGSAELLYKMANGQDVPYWTVLDAPLVTKDNTQYFYDLLAQVEPKFRQDAVNPDEQK